MLNIRLSCVDRATTICTGFPACVSVVLNGGHCRRTELNVAYPVSTDAVRPWPTCAMGRTLDQIVKGLPYR